MTVAAVVSQSGASHRAGRTLSSVQRRAVSRACARVFSPAAQSKHVDSAFTPLGHRCEAERSSCLSEEARVLNTPPAFWLRPVTVAPDDVCTEEVWCMSVCVCVCAQTDLSSVLSLFSAPPL